MIQICTAVGNRGLTRPYLCSCAGAFIAPLPDMPRQPQGFSLAIFAFILGICCPLAQSAAASEMGAGYAVDRTGRPYYVQVFARPLS